MAFQYRPFSKKQLQLLTWWADGSPFKDYNGVIAEGSVRAGKTLIMSLSFVLWSMQFGNGLYFGMAGKTIASFERNVLNQLKECLNLRGYRYKVKGNAITVSDGKHQNTYYVFGGRDERSQDLIQGVTLAGMLFDEAALMPRSFVNQAIARCSVQGSKLWFNCNPEGPMHWFYQEIIQTSDENKLLRIHFGLDDNPALSEEIKERYRNMFHGIFYKRFILGEWVFATGVIYDCFSFDKNVIDKSLLPIQIKEGDIKPVYGCDFGTFNPHVYLRGYIARKGNNPAIYITDEYVYDGRKSGRQKSTEDYVRDFEKFNGDLECRGIAIDPSASSLIVTHQQHGHIVRKAKNDVLSGINAVYKMLQSGNIIVCSNCKNLIAEFGMYRWNDKVADKQGKDEVVKEYDHCMDALRYMVMTFLSQYEIFRLTDMMEVKF